MPREMQIHDALKQLVAGNFSCQMSDCIANHVAEQSHKIETLTTLNERRELDIMQRDLHIHLLEREVTNLKKLLSGANMLHGLLTRALECATATKEKLYKIDEQTVRVWIGEVRARFLALSKSLGPESEKFVRLVQPNLHEAKKSFEKFASDIFSKIKAVA